MVTYFSTRKRDSEDKNVVEERDVDSIDIITEKYIVRIRTSGILVLDKVSKEPVLNQTLDLT